MHQSQIIRTLYLVKDFMEFKKMLSVFSPLFLQGTIAIGRRSAAAAGGWRRSAAGGASRVGRRRRRRREGGVRRRRSEGVLSYTSLHKNYIVMPV